MRSKGAEIARRYRERRDADPDRKRKYLEKERDKWKKDRDWKEERQRRQGESIRRSAKRKLLNSAHYAGTSVLEDELARVFLSLTLKLRGDRDFIDPPTSFIVSYDKMTTDSALRSAFSIFGNSPMAKTTGYQRPKGFLQMTAVGRRKARLEVLATRTSLKGFQGGPPL
ncbi:unnamed protein product [Boreogadus saida]